LVYVPPPPGPGDPAKPDEGKLKVPDAALENCPNPKIQWFRAVYNKYDGTYGMVPIEGATGTDINLADVIGYKVSAGVVCDGSNPLRPTYPWYPVEPTRPYKILLRYLRLDTGVLEIPIVAESYGPFGVDASYTGDPGVSGASTAAMWVTNSSGQRQVLSTYFIGSFGNDPMGPPWLVWSSAGAVPI